jgi:hypothetical protein
MVMLFLAETMLAGGGVTVGPGVATIIGGTVLAGAAVGLTVVGAEVAGGAAEPQATASIADKATKPASQVFQ